MQPEGISNKDNNAVTNSAVAKPSFARGEIWRGDFSWDVAHGTELPRSFESEWRYL